MTSKHVTTSKSSSWRQKHDVQKCHKVKKCIMMSKTRHEVNKFVMMSKSESWRPKHVMKSKYVMKIEVKKNRHDVTSPSNSKTYLAIWGPGGMEGASGFNNQTGPILVHIYHNYRLVCARMLCLPPPPPPHKSSHSERYFGFNINHVNNLTKFLFSYYTSHAVTSYHIGKWHNCDIRIIWI